MKLISCIKIVPDEQDVEVRPDKSLSFDKAEWKIGQYDLNALEAGAQLAGQMQGQCVALSLGTKELDNSKIKKNLLSRGPEEAVLIADDTLIDLDTHQTALLLKKAIEKIGDVGLVLCGEGSSDVYTKQVGIQLGALLGWPTINAVNKISANGNSITVERELENDVELLEVSLPAVISVSSDINTPRIPNVKDILAASKKKITNMTVDELGGLPAKSLNNLSTKALPQKERMRVISEDQAAFLDNFSKAI